MCDISRATLGKEQTTARWQVDETTTTDYMQLSWSTFFCDMWHIRWAYRLQQVCELEAEGRFRMCCKLHSTQCMKIFLRKWWISNVVSCRAAENQDTLYLKIVLLLIFTHWAAFVDAPKLWSRFFNFLIFCFVKPFIHMCSKESNMISLLSRVAY